MQDLIERSYNFLLTHPQYDDAILEWCQNGQDLNKIMSENSFSWEFEHDKEVISQLYKLIRIPLKEEVIFYRVVKDLVSNLTPGGVLSARQFTSVTTFKALNEDFGNEIMKITVPKGTPSFYISAWDMIHHSDRGEEETLLLLPGYFLYKGKEEFYNFLYYGSYKIPLSEIVPIKKFYLKIIS